MIPPTAATWSACKVERVIEVHTPTHQCTHFYCRLLVGDAFRGQKPSIVVDITNVCQKLKVLALVRWEALEASSIKVLSGLVKISYLKIPPLSAGMFF